MNALNLNIVADAPCEIPVERRMSGKARIAILLGGSLLGWIAMISAGVAIAHAV